MAQRVIRWVGGVVLACTAIAVVLLPPRAPRMRYGSGFYPRSWAFNRAQSQFDGAVNSLRLMRVRDSLSASASRATIAESNGLQVVADLGIPTRVTDPATVLIERAWEQMDVPQSRVPVMIAMLLDTSYTFEGLERSYLTRMRTSYALPTDRSARSACISIIDFGPDPQADAGEDLSLHAGGVSRLREGALGTCKYYAVFGMPGADIAQWLHRWEYVPIGSADWSAIRLEDEETRFSFSLFRFRGGNADLIGCVSGNRARCLAAVRSRPGEGRVAVQRARFAPPGVLVGRGGWWGSYDSRDALGWGVRYFVADMVVEFGRDRFAQFWTSDAPLEEAFERAMEIPLDEWTMRWARRYVGTPRTTGRFSSGSVLLSLLLAGVFVGAAGLYSVRRQVI